MKADTLPGQMRLLALETINANYPADQWLQVFTDGPYVENQANVGFGVYSELFTFFAAVGQNRSPFEGEIEAIKIALGQLCCRYTKFTNAVILLNSQSAIQSIGNREPSNTAEIYECKNLYQLLKEKNKTIVLQWIPAHCGIIGNERADTLSKKGTTILQAIDRPISFYTMKTLIRREFKTLRSKELKARTRENQWTASLSNIANWPRLEAVAEFRLCTGHDCLAKHLHRIGVCDPQEEKEKTHLIRCPALHTATETQRY
nr:reverse transcriptase [Hymenolepis microstoma]